MYRGSTQVEFLTSRGITMNYNWVICEVDYIERSTAWNEEGRDTNYCTCTKLLRRWIQIQDFTFCTFPELKFE